VEQVPHTAGAPARVPGTADPSRVMFAPPTVNSMIYKVRDPGCCLPHDSDRIATSMQNSLVLSDKVLRKPA